MGRGRRRRATVSLASSDGDGDNSVSDTQWRSSDAENLTLATQPFRTLQLFTMATVQYLKQSLLYTVRKGGWFILPIVIVLSLGLLLLTVDGPYGKHAEEFLQYFKFALWWVALGVASSIGLGYGLHTFVLYLAPHITFFTIKAVQCGRVDLKSATYDTIQLKRGPSWLEKNCSCFGSPVFPVTSDSLVTVPLSSILPQVQMEAILWGLGTALGELPPYFISRAASLSGSRLDVVNELDTVSSNDDGLISSLLKKTKRWLLSHAQHLNFFTVLLLASVPNPLFDLAGILCGQFGIPFWKFFLATLAGKAIIKTHIQTIFVISLCNNQLLEWVENELIWMLGLVPGFSNVLPNLVSKLKVLREKYMSHRSPMVPPSTQGKQWKLSFSLIWNSVVWMMMLSFLAKIVTSTAQGYLRKQQELELFKQAASESTNGKAHGASTSM